MCRRRPRKNWLTGDQAEGQEGAAEWNAHFAEYKKAYPELGAQFERAIKTKLAEGWEKTLPKFPAGDEAVATRNAGQVVMNAIGKVVPELFGGAADLTTSTKTIFKDSPSFHVDPDGPQRVFRRARVWHDGDGEWHGGARRRDSVRVDILHVSRITAGRRCAWRAMMSDALAVRVHA